MVDSSDAMALFVTAIRRGRRSGAMTDNPGNITTDAGITAGAVVGALSGARLLSGVVPVPSLEPTVERLDEGVLPRRAGLTVGASGA
jgi:hypothetical protein